MTIAVITLAIALAGALGIITWLVHGRVGAADHEAEARVDLADVEGDFERAQFELEVTKKALDAAHARAAALQEVLSDELEKQPNPDLGRADIAGRVRRIFERWQTADADRNRALPADGSEPVPDAQAARPTAAPALPAGAGGVS